jgi:hypothetical protein
LALTNGDIESPRKPTCPAKSYLSEIAYIDFERLTKTFGQLGRKQIANFKGAICPIFELPTVYVIGGFTRTRSTHGCHSPSRGAPHLISQFAVGVKSMTGAVDFGFTCVVSSPVFVLSQPLKGCGPTVDLPVFVLSGTPSIAHLNIKQTFYTCKKFAFN